jgi:hypothetical protein
MVMGRTDWGHYAGKGGPGKVVDPMIRQALMKRAADGRLPCAVAFDVARQLGVMPGVVGAAADLMDLRLVKCQLGLFGYAPKKKIIKPARSVPAWLEEAIREALVGDCLSCRRAWQIAKQGGIHRMKVSAACDNLKIKIRPCQLGAF